MISGQQQGMSTGAGHAFRRTPAHFGMKKRWPRCCRRGTGQAFRRTPAHFGREQPAERRTKKQEFSIEPGEIHIIGWNPDYSKPSPRGCRL
jgi:hypothetical protein